jgi:GT2 family glycosyltransferase
VLVDVLIVNFRSAALLIDCLASLDPELRDDSTIRVRICENGSGDDSVPVLDAAIRRLPWADRVDFVPLNHNRGFTGGNNVLIARSLASKPSPGLLLLLNPDTTVAAGAIGLMRDRMLENPRWGVAGPAIASPSGEPQTSCFRDPTPWSEFLRSAGTGPLDRFFNRRLVSIKPPHGTGPHEWTSFACAMIRTDAMRQAGAFDEGYFAYFDDPDLCWRIRRAGWSIGHCPDAQIVHHEGASTGIQQIRTLRKRVPGYKMRGRTRYFAKRHGIVGLWRANLCWHAGRSISMLRELFGRRPISAAPSEWRDIWIDSLRPWNAPHLPYPDEPMPPDPLDGSAGERPACALVAVR